MDMAPAAPGAPAGAAAEHTRRVMQTILGYRAAKILFTAAYLDCFTLIHKGRRTLKDLCRSLKTDPRATRILLDALVPLGFLNKSGEIYSNTPLSEQTLVKGTPGYLGDNLAYQEILSEAWEDLTGAVRRGRTARPLEYWLFRHKTFFRDYILAMHNIAERPARELASLLNLRGVNDVLDVGSGPGTFTIALLEKRPSLRAVFQDLPSTNRIARALLAKHPLGRQVSFKNGDYTTANFGKERFDLVLMSHITHNEGEDTNKKLIAKAFAALRPGGQAVLHDFMLETDRTRPLFGALFSVHMLVCTKSGRTYSAQEYGSWLREAGFRDVRVVDVCKDSPNASRAVIGYRRQ
jgi:3-hydroxy-5-methyl-1-naphthoate 3-O-methyltransferase